MEKYREVYIPPRLRWWEKRSTWQIIECVGIAVMSFVCGWLFAEILKLIKL